MKSTGERIPATVKWLSVVSLFNDFASEMVYPLLPALVTQTLGGGAIILSLVDSASEVASALTKWASGRLADRPAWRRPLILGGYLTAVLVRPLTSFASAAWQVVGFRVIDRIGKGLRTPPRDALLADVTPPPLRGRAFGFHRGADHFGAVIGSVAAWWFLHSGANVRQVIEWSIAPGLIAFVILSATLRREGRWAEPGWAREKGGSGSAAPRGGEARGGATAGAAAPGATPADPIAEPPTRRFWLPILALTALTVARVPEALLLLRLQDAGIAVAIIPLVWAALHVIRSAGSYPGGALTDWLGPRRVVAAGGVLFAAVVAAMGLNVGAMGTAVAFLIFGLVAGLMEPAERALVARLAPRRTGRGFGVYHALTGIAVLPAGVAFGAIYQRAGGGPALWSSAAAMVAAVLLWLAVAPHGTESGAAR